MTIYFPEFLQFFQDNLDDFIFRSFQQKFPAKITKSNKLIPFHPFEHLIFSYSTKTVNYYIQEEAMIIPGMLSTIR